jgi:hypothetical protein
MFEQYPKEFFIEINNQPEYLGRITINKSAAGFSGEMDILLSETRKIFKHVGRIYNLKDEVEAVNESMQQLSNFLRVKNEK